VGGLLERLIVIDAEYGDVHGRVEDKSAVLRSEIARPCMSHDRIGVKPWNWVRFTRATPSILDFCQEMGNVRGVLKSRSKS
jgi:hypothetical protein